MKTYDYEQLKDSKILYDKNPPHFMPFIIIAITILIGALTYISINANKTYVVRCNGIVQSFSKEYIKSDITGYIVERSTEEGKEIHKGDTVIKLNSGELNYNVNSSADGILHFVDPLLNGTVVQAGDIVASVSGKDDFFIEIYVSSEERPKISKDDTCEVYVNGLSKSEYGGISGILENIDSDATIDTSTRNAMFKARVKLDKNYLNDKHGNKVYISPGMTVNTVIKYDKISYFNYIIEGLGIKL